jgi:hypothetical protein
MAAPCCLTMTASEYAESERAIAAHVAALLAERDGEPINVNSSDLPRGLAPPFDQKWTGSRRRFVVTADDTITLKQWRIR